MTLIKRKPLRQRSSPLLSQILINAGCEISKEESKMEVVLTALKLNAENRERVQTVMEEIEFPQHVAQCEEVLNFLFLQPRI